MEQQFNSLHAQREAAEAYIKSQRHEGWRLLAEKYDDGGYSGGNLERPALKHEELVWRKSRRDRRFAVTRCWSGGDSKRQPHPPKSLVVPPERQLKISLFSTSRADGWRRRKLLCAFFGMTALKSPASQPSLNIRSAKRTGCSNPLRSTNESLRTAGTVRVFSGALC